MDRCQFLPLPLQRLFVTREKAPVREGKERMVNLLFQETSNLSLQANVTSQKPVLRKTGDSELFLASACPRLLFLSFTPLPLFFTSIHPLLRRAPLTAETPLCTQVLLGLHGSPQKLCVCWSVFEWEQKRWYDLPWQTGFVIQYFKLYSLSTNLPEPLTHNCAWSNGGYSSGSWLQPVSESFKNCLWAKQH